MTSRLLRSCPDVSATRSTFSHFGLGFWLGTSRRRERRPWMFSSLEFWFFELFQSPSFYFFCFFCNCGFSLRICIEHSGLIDTFQHYGGRNYRLVVVLWTIDLVRGMASVIGFVEQFSIVLFSFLLSLHRSAFLFSSLFFLFYHHVFFLFFILLPDTIL